MATLIKEYISLGLAYSLEVYSIIISTGSMVACRLRHGAGEVDESSTSRSMGIRKRIPQWAGLNIQYLKAQPPGDTPPSTKPYQQGHTSSNTTPYESKGAIHFPSNHHRGLMIVEVFVLVNCSVLGGLRV